VFIVTNSLMLVGGVVGLTIVRIHRQREGAGRGAGAGTKDGRLAI
jgi:hypothetical protein